MGIQSTMTVKRDIAIDRIKHIYAMAERNDYDAISKSSSENSDSGIEEFVRNEQCKDITHIDKWTNKMLEDFIDRRFYRWSMFEDYNVVD